MLNDALQHLTQPGWIIFTDADVFLNAQLRDFLRAYPIDPELLYGTTRYDVQPDPSPLDFLNSELKFTGLPSMGGNAEPNGYFQLFNRNARAAIRDRWPAVMCRGILLRRRGR